MLNAVAPMFLMTAKSLMLIRDKSKRRFDALLLVGPQ